MRQLHIGSEEITICLQRGVGDCSVNCSDHKRIAEQRHVLIKRFQQQIGAARIGEQIEACAASERIITQSAIECIGEA